MVPALKACLTRASINTISPSKVVLSDQFESCPGGYKTFIYGTEFCFALRDLFSPVNCHYAAAHVSLPFCNSYYSLSFDWSHMFSTCHHCQSNNLSIHSLQEKLRPGHSTLSVFTPSLSALSPGLKRPLQTRTWCFNLHWNHQPQKSRTTACCEVHVGVTHASFSQTHSRLQPQRRGLSEGFHLFSLPHLVHLQ